MVRKVGQVGYVRSTGFSLHLKSLCYKQSPLTGISLASKYQGIIKRLLLLYLDQVPLATEKQRYFSTFSLTPFSHGGDAVAISRTDMGFRPRLFFVLDKAPLLPSDMPAFSNSVSGKSKGRMEQCRRESLEGSAV